jgi:outer membrane immunogenic protein
MFDAVGHATPTASNIQWGGVYVGGHGGYSSSDIDMRSETGPLLRTYFRNSAIGEESGVADLKVIDKKKDVRETSYGGFIGYNIQWEDAVFGFEADYSRVNLKHEAFDGIGRTLSTTSDGSYDIGILSLAKSSLTDVATLRLRGGYAIGNFLPFITAGLAVGRADRDSGAAIFTGRPGSTDVASGFISDKKKGEFQFGAAAGLGTEIALAQGVFLRAEYQYLYFSEIRTTVQTARGGLGVKFEYR